MIFVKKELLDGRKYLTVGPIRLEYSTVITRDQRIFRLGPLRLRYQFDPEENAGYLHLFGLKLRFRSGAATRKWQHYQMRQELDTATRKQLLLEEIPAHLGYTPDLDNPQTYNEKILWMKLHECNPLIRVCCDKYAVKEYVSKTISPDLVLPVLGAWDDPAEIDFSALPDAFALKVNWSSGYNIIVRDKSTLDIEETVTRLTEWMRPHKNSFYQAFNWGYMDMKPVVYAEPYIEQIDGQVYDYKFCFTNGEHLYTLIATDRSCGLTKDFFDPDFNHLDVSSGGSPHADPIPEKPKHYDRMLAIAKELAKPFLFVRVDFYEVGDTIYVGEMTFYPGGGKLPLSPDKWDREWGRKIRLPDTPNVYEEKTL